MPELPEVETTRRGIAPYLEGARVQRLVVREPRLRWPVPADLGQRLRGRRIRCLRRRGKYLLADCGEGALLLHLGMSGSLRIVDPDAPPGRHDHFDICLDNGRVLRFCDPRRFGCLLWATGDRDEQESHELLAGLGPEPLSSQFDGAHLYGRSRGRRVAVKAFIMDAAVVVGVGNIYATEALFHAGIDPRRQAGRIARARYERLAATIREVLERAILRGGTTLRDYVDGRGQPGYFSQELFAYGRAGEPCRTCSTPMRLVSIGQRASVFCPACQR